MREETAGRRGPPGRFAAWPAAACEAGLAALTVHWTFVNRERGFAYEEDIAAFMWGVYAAGLTASCMSVAATVHFAFVAVRSRGMEDPAFVRAARVWWWTLAAAAGCQLLVQTAHRLLP